MHGALGEVVQLLDGFGFAIRNENGAPMVSFGFETRELATEAHALMEQALEDVRQIVAFTGRRQSPGL